MNVRLWHAPVPDADTRWMNCRLFTELPPQKTRTLKRQGQDPERSVSERFGHIHLLPAMGSQGSAVAKVAGVEDIKVGIVGTGLSEFDAKHCIRSS